MIVFNPESPNEFTADLLLFLDAARDLLSSLTERTADIDYRTFTALNERLEEFEGQWVPA